MFSAMARAAAVGLPWLAVMAVSGGLGYGMNVAVTSGVSMTTPAEESVSGVNEQELLALVGRKGWDIIARDKVTVAPDPVLPNGDEAWTIKGPNGQLEDMVVTPMTGPDSGTVEYKLAPNGSPHAAAYGVIARPVGSEGCVSNGWMVYVGLNSWIHDPGRPTPCQDESTVGR